MKKVEAEVAYYSSVAFYMLKGVKFTKQLTSDHTVSRDRIMLLKTTFEQNQKRISIIYHYRAEYAGRSKLPERLQRLNKSMHILLKTASNNTVAVVVTNHQMQSSIDGSFDNLN
ncbi:MAG: hypothetical protein WAM14_06180 [Candidatus Nitrosopolaris sp.]